MTDWERRKEQIRSLYLRSLISNIDRIKICVNLKRENQADKDFKIWLN